MRVGVFWEAMSAYQEEKEAERRHLGELARGATARLINIQLKKGDQIRDVRKLWRMPWDEGVDEDEELERLASLTDEERDKEVAKLLDLVRNGNR